MLSYTSIIPRYFVVVINVRDREALRAFGLHLRRLRLQARMSQEILTYTADVSISQISRLERGLINPTLCTLIVLSVALDVSIAILVSY